MYAKVLGQREIKGKNLDVVEIIHLEEGVSQTVLNEERVMIIKLDKDYTLHSFALRFKQKSKKKLSRYMQFESSFSCRYDGMNRKGKIVFKSL